jgi:hypothetical protein
MIWFKAELSSVSALAKLIPLRDKMAHRTEMADYVFDNDNDFE